VEVKELTILVSPRIPAILVGSGFGRVPDRQQSCPPG
jgi:hypothetical protein